MSVSRALQMEHDVDPRQEIFERVGGNADGLELYGRNILTGIYIRPEKTKGGIHLSDSSRDEDIYQGKVQLVLAVGPDAFAPRVEHGQIVQEWDPALVPKPGDWVLIRVGDSFPFVLGDQQCRIIEDRNVKMKLLRPDIAI
jgi:hypothetical protein